MLLSIVYYSLFAGNLLLCFRQKKSTFVLICILLLLGLMFYANDATYGDHITYMEDYYAGERSREGDILFGYFMTWISEFGLSYQLFLLCVYIFDLIFISLGIRAYTKNPHVFIAVSMFYIFPFFSMGIRYSMAMSVFLFSLQYIKENKILYFIICLVVSSMIHLCLAFSSLLLLCFYKKLTKDEVFDKTEYPYWSVLVILFLFMLSMYMNGSFMFSSYATFLLGKYGLENRGMIYLENGIGNGNGMFLLLPEFVISYLLSQKMVCLTKVYKDTNDNFSENYKIAKITYLINVISCVFYALFCVTPSFLRLLVIPTFMNCVMLARIYDNIVVYSQNNTIKNVTWINILFALFVFTWIIPVVYNMFGCTILYWLETANRYLHIS